MPTVIGTNLPTIAIAVEQQLLTFISVNTNAAVVGSISNIYWIERGQEPPVPAMTGQRDVLLTPVDERYENVQGDARFALMYSGIDVYLRSSYLADKRATRKDWMIAHAAMVDALKDALADFFPVDGQNNSLTVEGFVADTQSSPERIVRDSANWGMSIGSYRFHYNNRLNKSILG